jgi:PAS domain S-box-containing protein
MDPSKNQRQDEADAIAEAIFEAIADPVFVIDFVEDGLAGQFRYVNEAAARLLNIPREELQAMRPGTVDEIPEEVIAGAYHRLITEGRATFETLMIAADGTRIPMEIHASNARLSGRPVCIAVARTLVARKEMELKMLEAKEAAEAANRAKSEFLAIMSHEIRTPLHGVIGFASLLDGIDVPERYREPVSGIRDSAQLLLSLVNDVLDFSRIEAGQLELQLAPLNLDAQMRRIAAAFKLRAEEKGLEFSFVESDELASAVMADVVRIEQVLGNLLSNALKFTEKGTITLAVESLPLPDGDKCEIRFSISDTGIGIRTDQIPRLFNPFIQADGSLSRRHGGSGLGLVIVRKLCELMGGTAAVESRFGEGSTFTASISAQVLGEVASSSLHHYGPGTDEETPPLRILVAEDNGLNRRLVTRMIERLGYTAHLAVDGREAVDFYQKEPYDLILMDVSMPGMNGLEATRVIRTLEKTARLLPSWILALTAGVSENERQACQEAGMDDFLGKPFTEGGLWEAVKKAREARRGK